MTYARRSWWRKFLTRLHHRVVGPGYRGPRIFFKEGERVRIVGVAGHDHQEGVIAWAGPREVGVWLDGADRARPAEPVRVLTSEVRRVRPERWKFDRYDHRQSGISHSRGFLHYVRFKHVLFVWGFHRGVGGGFGYGSRFNGRAYAWFEFTLYSPGLGGDKSIYPKCRIPRSWL